MLRIPAPRRPALLWLISLATCFAALIAALIRLRGSFGRHATIPIAVIALSLLFVLFTRDYPDGDRMGPATMPRLLSVCVCWLAVGAIPASNRVEQHDSSSASRQPGRTDLVVRLAIALVGYVIATIIFGYIVSTFLFLILQVRTLGERRMPVVLAVSVGWIVFAYIVFERTLNIRLPTGIVWNLLK